MERSRRGTAIARQAVLVVIVAVLGLFGEGAAHAESNGLTGQGVVPGATNGDYVHISNTPPASASAHGWWTYSKETELKADVTVQLQVNRGGTWVDVGRPGVERVRPGGGFRQSLERTGPLSDLREHGMAQVSSTSTSSE